MTTFVDPLGIVADVHGTTGIVTLTSTSSSPYTEIPRDCGWMVAVVTSPGSGNSSVMMPTGSQVGDLVEVHFNGPASQLSILPQSGETINSNQVTQGWGCLFRKVSSTQWMRLGYAL